MFSLAINVYRFFVEFLNGQCFDVPGFQFKSGPYFNISNLFTKIYNTLYYTTNLYLQ
jgi:hypothetical protein